MVLLMLNRNQGLWKNYLIRFFDNKAIIHNEFAPSNRRQNQSNPMTTVNEISQTITDNYCLEVWKRLINKITIRCVRPDYQNVGSHHC